MRAVTIVDGGLIWQEHPDPVAGSGEVLVAVRAAGLNSADMIQRRGLYPAPPGSPQDIPGLELAGEIVAVGPGVTRFSAGDAVMAVVGGGAQAELAVVHERCAIPVPPGIEWPQAAGFPEAFTTAHDALFTQCRLRTGERLCVHGAAGGVGLAGVQLGVAAGAIVVATVRHPPLRDEVSNFGATVVAPEDFTNHGPFDVVLELVGSPNMSANLRALASQGRIAVIGVGAGREPSWTCSPSCRSGRRSAARPCVLVLSRTRRSPLAPSSVKFSRCSPTVESGFQSARRSPCARQPPRTHVSKPAPSSASWSS